MKLTDDERQWVENQNRIWDDVNQCFYVDETVEQLLKSEQAAWEEVERIQQEKEVWHNGWLIFNESLLRMAYEVKRLKEENKQITDKLQDALNTISSVREGLKWGDPENSVDAALLKLKQAIDRIQSQEGLKDEQRL